MPRVRLVGSAMVVWMLINVLQPPRRAVEIRSTLWKYPYV
jgi:hypothetical protein